MASGTPAGHWWMRNRYPVLIGAIVGLFSGVFGILVTASLNGSPSGGFVGAICCGVTVGLLSEGGLSPTLVNALVADAMSSIAFFLLAVGGYLTYVWATEGLSAFAAILGSSLAVVVALGVAVPVGIISLCLAGVSGGVTALVRHRGEKPIRSK